MFGSYARGDADENSDVDVLVDIDHSNSGRYGIIIPGETMNLLNKKVDVVSFGWENKNIKPFIDKDKYIIYERANF